MIAFRTNHDIAIAATDQAAAERFYSGVPGFKLQEKTSEQLVYDTDYFNLHIAEEGRPYPPVPSFTVENRARASSATTCRG